MRSFLTAASFLSALFIGSTALAAPHLHAKLDLPPGWHQQIGSLDQDKGKAYSFNLYNPTLEARAKIEVVRTSLAAPADACQYYLDKIVDSGGESLATMDSGDGIACGFVWTSPRFSGVSQSQYLVTVGIGWTAVINLVYPSDIRSSYWLGDIQTISESLELEYR